jgi:LysM repeat protein
MPRVFAASPACMIAPAMVGWRNPARYLAPLALIAAAAATYVIVHHALKHQTASSPPAIVQTTSTTGHATGSHTRSHKAKFYVVRPNDTLSTIAARTGVSLSTLESLNPSINPNALQPGHPLRLRR